MSKKAIKHSNTLNISKDIFKFKNRSRIHVFSHKIKKEHPCKYSHIN